MKTEMNKTIRELLGVNNKEAIAIRNEVQSRIVGDLSNMFVMDKPNFEAWVMLYKEV